MRLHTSVAALGLFGVKTAIGASQEFEYVVIGSGAGGGPLAANLARNGHLVLLLEAGEHQVENPLSRIPIRANAASEDPALSWSFFVNHYEDLEEARKDSKFTWKTANGTFFVGSNPPEGSEPLGSLYPRGATIGGSTMTNAAGLALPPDNDWEHIADLTGDDSWRVENMRKYFERLENNHYLPEGTEGHGFSGWLGSNRDAESLYAPDDGLISLIGNGMTILGDAQNPSEQETLDLLNRDANAADSDRMRDGIRKHALHHDELHRRSSAGTYIRDTARDGGFPLTVSTSSLATKILFDDSLCDDGRRRVTGVEYLKGHSLYRADPRHTQAGPGELNTVYASKEVIVAGGAFNTPQILKLSGIGAREELDEFDIPMQLELPAVGTNLQDNYEVAVDALASRDFHNAFANCTFLAPGVPDPCLDEFEKSGTGPYTFGPFLSLLMRTSQSENADPDLWFFGSTGSGFHGFWPGYSNSTDPQSNFWWSIVKMQVQNRAGTVKLRSADPQDVPVIDFHYFSEGRETDLTALKEGVQMALDIFNTTDELGPFDISRPGEDVEHDILYESWGHHASCSCPMGVDQETSCVDSRFKVHGVENLRIVDGSVFPRVPGAFPVLATYMISEKAADVILQDARDSA